MRELSESEKSIIKLLVQRENYITKNPWDWFGVSIGSIYANFARDNNSHFEIIDTEPDDEEYQKEVRDIESEGFIARDKPKFVPHIKLTTYSKTNNSALSESNIFRREFITALYFIDYHCCPIKI